MTFQVSSRSMKVFQSFSCKLLKKALFQKLSTTVMPTSIICIAITVSSSSQAERRSSERVK